MKDMVGMKDGTILVNVHTVEQCAGQICCIHNPSDHHMSHWQHHWDDLGAKMMRECPHGFMHPDPDALDFRRRKWGHMRASLMSIHDCDGCCQPVQQKQIGS